MSAAWQLPSKDFAARHHLLLSTEVPAYQKQPFILSGYRPTPQGCLDYARSFFTLHNETGNIWTHMAGFGYFLGVGADVCRELQAEGTEVLGANPIWMILLVVASAFCLFWSVAYHVCACGSNCVNKCTLKMDHSGIVMLIVFSYLTGIALGFHCFPTLCKFYLAYAACISIALALPLVRPKLIGNQARHFIGCCALGFVPAVHFVCIGRSDDVALAIPYLCAMFGFYGLGAAFYLAHWPERGWPGRFDLIGHSHQLWHICVVLAAASWVRGCHAILKATNATDCEEVLLGHSASLGET